MSKELRRPRRPTRAFSDLKGVTASTLSVEQYDDLVSKAYLEGSNKALLENIDLLARSKQSPSGPRAGSMKIVSISPTDTGKEAWFTPNQGEVWMVEYVAMEATSSSTWTTYLTLAIDGVEMPLTQVISGSGNSVKLPDDLGWPPTNAYLDENTTLYLGTGGSLSSFTAYLLLTRRR